MFISVTYLPFHFRFILRDSVLMRHFFRKLSEFRQVFRSHRFVLDLFEPLVKSLVGFQIYFVAEMFLDDPIDFVVAILHFGGNISNRVVGNFVKSHLSGVELSQNQEFENDGVGLS